MIHWAYLTVGLLYCCCWEKRLTVYMCGMSCGIFCTSQVSRATDSKGWLFAWRLWALRCRGWAERERIPSWHKMTWACCCRGILHTLFTSSREAISWRMFSFSGLLHVFLSSSFRQNQQGLAQLAEKELRRVSQQLDKLIHLHHHEHHRPSPRGGLNLHTGKKKIVPLVLSWHLKGPPQNILFLI